MSQEAGKRTARLWRRILPSNPSLGQTPPYMREVDRKDAEILGALLFEAFSGTIDDAGQREMHYVQKVEAILDGRYGDWVCAASWNFIDHGTLRSVCLVSDYKPYGCPVIAVVATAPEFRQRGDANTLLDAAVRSLAMLGYSQCCAMVTVGNHASERLFSSCGFVPDSHP
jgi:GNAT superfamily N-acetyltransferase